MTAIERSREPRRLFGDRRSDEDFAPRVIAVAVDDALRADLRGHQPMWADLESLDSFELEHVDAIVVDARALTTPTCIASLAVMADRIPTLLVHGEDDAAHAAAIARNAGVASVMQRPVDADEVTRRLSLLAEVRRLRRALSVTEAALEHSVTGLAISDLKSGEQQLVYVSPTFERMTGWTADEVLGKNCSVLQCASSSPEAVGEMRSAIRARATSHVVIENQRKDGTRFWNEVTLFPIHADDGRFLYYGGVQHDVTELVQARAELARVQRELAERHAFTLAILEGLQVAIATTDQEGIVTFVNPAACAVLGVSPDLCLGRTAEDVLQLPATATEWMRSRASGATRVEYVFHTSMGSAREIGASIRRAESSPEGLGHFFVFRDLAETRQAERIERLAAVSTMAAGFAHEVRNPLASVRMFGEILLAELDAGGEHHDIVARMLSQVNRIERLVRTSLQMARPERPKKGEHWPSVLLNGALEALVPRLRSLPGTLDVQVEENLPRVSCEDAHVVQVLVILSNNALDVTQDASRVRIEVTEEREHSELERTSKRVVRFSVMDDGPGVPEHLRAAIFHPFFTTKPQGTGLGLSIAQQIAHENGGRIELTPRVQGGSVFSLVLPTVMK